MFSGKSTELARRIRRHKMANRQCIVVKYAGDTRYEDEPGRAEAGTADAANLRGCVVTHDRQALVAYPARALEDVDNVVHAFDVVGIDEGQFFGDLVEFCERWARLGKTVIVAALDATFQRKPFNDVLSLVPIAEDVTKLSAVCNACGCDASFTKRVGSSDETVELIGGEGMYVATCRGCHDLPASSFPQRGTNTHALAAASTPAAQAVLQDAIWRVAGGTDVEILSVTAAARGSGIDVSYRITSPDLAASRDVAERLADVAANPALFDRAVAEAAAAAS